MGEDRPSVRGDDVAGPPQVSQPDADALSTNGDFDGYQVPAVWSKMLTVWRKLHVELDTMAAEPQTVSERSPDWQERFIVDKTINSASTTLHLSPSLSGHNAHQFEGGRMTVVDNGWTESIIDHTDDTIEIDRVLTPPEWSYVIGHNAIIKDDDPTGGLLPKYHTVSALMVDAYKDAYVLPMDLESQYNPNRLVDFELYLTWDELVTGWGWNNSKDQDSSHEYWTSFLVAAYQRGGATILNPAGGYDNDPDPFLDNSTFPSGPFWPDGYEEGIQSGMTTGSGDWNSIVFRAAIADCPRWDGRESQVIAHEIGHSAGNTGSEEEHHNEDGLMSSNPWDWQVKFTAPTLRRFREVQKW